MPEREYVDFKALKRQVSMHDLLKHYNLTEEMEEKDEETLTGPCPITSSSSETAFKVNTAKDIWYSFVLEDGGNILDFVAQMEETDIVGAANRIDEWFEREEGSEEPTAAEEESESLETTQESFYDGIDELCSDELALIRDAATRELREALTSGDTGDIEIEAKTGALTDWILRAYQTGYRHGKMTGRVEGRVESLRDR